MAYADSEGPDQPAHPYSPSYGKYILKAQITLRMCSQSVSVMAYADSEGLDQTAHMRSLIRAFTVCLQDHRIPYLP